MGVMEGWGSGPSRTGRLCGGCPANERGRFGFSLILEAELERCEDGVVLGATGLTGSQRLHP
jgi:hypothetical protein